MKIQVKAAPRVFVEATGDSHTALFEQVAALQEVFGTFNQCGKCNSEDLRFVVRTDSARHTYYELHCQKCRARLAFGQNDGDKKGSLYPRRKETAKQSVMGGSVEAGGWLPDNGWVRWNKEKQKSE